MSGVWRLYKEWEEGYWTHALKRTWCLRRWKVDDRLLGGKYEIFEIHRRWYNTVTREFQTTVEVLKTFEDVLAEGRAVYDYRNSKYIVPEEVAV